MMRRTAIPALVLFSLFSTHVAVAGPTVTLKAVKKNNVAITPTTEVIGVAGDVFECEFYIAGWSGFVDLARGYNFKVAGIAGVGDGGVLPVGWDAPIAPQYCFGNSDCHDPAYPLCTAIEPGICLGTMHHPEQGAFVTTNRPDFILVDFTPIGGIGTPTLDYVYGLTAMESDGMPDLGGSYYAATLRLEIEPEACGNYIWGTIYGSKDSFLVDVTPHADVVRLTGIPLNIHVAPPHDCSDDRLHLFSEFANCFTASGVQAPAGCAEFDRDTDGDVDLADYLELFAP